MPVRASAAWAVWPAPLLLLLLGAQQSPLAAQTPAARSCDGQIVSAVMIERQPPTVIERTSPAWVRPLLSVALQHKTTEAYAVRPFLLLREGESCSEFGRAESERLLRAQPYLADASVAVIPDPAGGVRVHVTTVDEIPILVGGRLRGDRIAGVKYGSTNVAGSGMYASTEWREGFAYRDGLGFRFTNYHAFGEPNRFSLTLDRAPLSTGIALTLQRPLLTSHQRTAWYIGFSDGSRYAPLVRPEAPALALALDHTRVDVGGIVRLGGKTRRVFAGPLLSHERVDAAARAVIVTDTGFVSVVEPDFRTLFGPRQRTRVSGVLGARLLSFIKVHGFDTLIGAQDVGTGIQVATIAGRSFSPTADGTVFGADLYAASGSPTSLVALRGQWEGEKQQETNEWVDAVASGRLAWYRKLSKRRTLIAGGEFAGAWRSGVPYQIPLGKQAGVRGFRDSRVVGARRAVARAEHRWVLGNMTRYMIVGAAGFLDAGSVWAGRVPFGENSGLRASMGGALLVSIPPQSRRMLRVEVALPFTRDHPGSYELRVGTTAPLRTFWNEPGVVSSLRTISPPARMFGLP